MINPLILVFLIFFFDSPKITSATATATLPHIIFIVSDDLGFDDVGYKSHQINTPNIDWLAYNGVVLDEYYLQSVCSPSRAALLTGRYPLHTSINDWIQPASATGVPLNETLLPQILSKVGYQSHAIGKWHLGFYTWPHTPTFRGFQSFYGYYGGGEDYFTHKESGNYDFRNDSKPECGKGCSLVASEALGSYSTHLFTTAAINVIKKHNASQPLFLYLAYQAVHAPAEVPESYITPYNGVIQNSTRKTFAGMLSCLDEGIGNVTQALKNAGLWDNALIIFTTDNGGPTQETPGGDFVGSSNYPLKGGKHSTWEGGTRGFGVVYSNNYLAMKNYTNENLMHVVDWFPTLASIAGVSVEGLPLDGINQWDSINKNQSTTRTEIWYGMHDDPLDGQGLRMGQWKLLVGDPTTNTPNGWYPPLSSSLPPSPSMIYSSNPHSLGQCTMEVGVCYPGNDISNFNCSNLSTCPQTCCDTCLNNTKCAGWTYNQDSLACFIKTVLASPGKDGDCISGSGSSPLPPYPPANETVLFNLVLDPYEHQEVSKANPTVVTQLYTRMNEYLITGVPNAKDDASCPPWKAGNDPVVGPTLEPWC